MKSNNHWTVRATQTRAAALAFGLACVCFLGSSGNAVGQTPGPSEPPLTPPTVRDLPDGKDTLSLGQWLLYPTLSLHSFYDTNLYSNPTPVSAWGFNFNPSLLAVHDTGIHTTSLYGNINSSVYPFIEYQNNTFNRQAGVIEKYEAMRDLIFTVQGDYTHNTNASVFTQSLPGPVVSPAAPGLQGAAGVVAVQQTVVNPNDVFTSTGTIYKEFNRAFVTLNGSLMRTEYANQSLATNYTSETYGGSGGFWFSPLLYAYANASQAFQLPAVGANSNAYRAIAGIGSAEIGLFKGSMYFGRQGSEVDGAGTAGGDVYGGVISYSPTSVWNVSASVDRITNISNITTTATLGNPQALANVPLSAAPIPSTASVRVTALALRSDYAFSEQTSVFGVLGLTRTNYLDTPQLDNSWVASVGIRHSLSDRLTLTFDYQFSSVSSNQPGTSFSKSYTGVGAVYRF